MTRRYFVYQLVGHDGECLYIGSSYQADLTKRMAHHVCTSGFGPSIASIEAIEEYSTYQAMCLGEVEWINAVMPPKNIATWQTRSLVEPGNEPRTYYTRRERPRPVPTPVPAPSPPSGNRFRLRFGRNRSQSETLANVSAANARRHAERLQREREEGEGKS